MNKLNGFLTRKLKEKISIGIIGIGMGCGATHLTIALANYLQSGLGKKTAVIELSGREDLKSMIRKEGRGRCPVFYRYLCGENTRNYEQRI